MSQLTRFIPKSGPGSGTVTAISAGTGLTATPTNPITTTGTISLTIPVSIADGGTNATSFTNTDGVVYFDGTRLVDTTVGTLGQVLTSQGAGLPPQFAAVPASSITITGDSGSSTGNNFEFTGNTTGLTFTSGSEIIDLGGTLIVSNGGTGATTLTTHGVLLGNGTSAVTATTAGTTGQVLTGVTGGAPTFQSPAASSITITGDSGGGLTGNSFTFTGSSTGLTFAGAGSTETLGGILVVSHGGTGQTTFTANEILASGSTATGSFQQITNGTAGQVLTANASGLPTFQNAASSGITTIDGDTGSVTGTTVSFIAQLHAGQTVKFSGSGTTMDLLVTDANGNTTIGGSAGAGGQTGSSNTSIGLGSLGLLSSGSNNTAAGTGASTAITTGSFNVSMGYGSLNSLKTGNYNIALGQEAGNAYTGSETANILIGNTGTVGESNVIRIGTQGTTAGEQNACYIAGIAGTTVSNINAVTINTATGQLGSEAFPSSSISITGDSGGALSGTSFTFTGGSTGLTFAGSGTTETLGGTLIVGNGGTGATTLTTHGVLLGNGTSAVTATAVGTTGQVLTGVTGGAPTFQSPAASSITITGDSGGGLSGNSFTFTGGSTGLTFAGSGTTETLGGTVTVSHGGTGDTSFTAYSVITGGTTSTGALQNVSGVGTSGQILTSQGAGALPQWAAPAASSISITGNSGGALTGNSFTFTGGTTGLTFSGSGSTETLGGTLIVGNGGTGATTLTSHGVLLGNGTSAVTATAVGTTGQVLTGVTGGAPTFQSPASGSTYFQAYRTTNQTISTNVVTTIVYDTAISNVGSAYNTSTGIFTAPATGYYSFCSTTFINPASTSGSTTCLLAYTGSVQSARLSQLSNSTNEICVTNAWAMPMTSGDTVQMVSYYDGSGTYLILGSSESSGAVNVVTQFSGWRIA